MQELTTNIDINATPDKVWRVLTDINQWKDWNPIVNQATGKASAQGKLDIVMRGKDGKNGPRYSPVVTDFEEPSCFRWRAKMITGFLFTNDKVFELEETSTGTRVTHKEVFSGLLAPLFCGNIEKGVTPMLNSMNEALKKVAEKSAV